MSKCIAALLIASTSSFLSQTDTLLSASSEEVPIGIFLWFPGPGAPKSDADCQALVERVKPSKKQVEQWLWGRTPDVDPGMGPYYLVLSDNRMEPTFSAEGDLDGGDVKLGPTKGGETPFTLVPDDHPDTTITGTIVAKPGSQVLAVTLHDIPVDDAGKDRTVYYCRFEEPATET
ncbi:hypothetical protein [Mesorhizobium delmotii]|uniref:Uncharacterized protein n=1 Tax=Mesorhizobium delmotii TaxID=1631247 RepID=A0A2P9ARC1_9HYPH|nr:hypothetical protein [Mesorhizobium delmotii]SJM33696.1 conserved hypothetical protein [Mesorhizobium delmotii]